MTSNTDTIFDIFANHTDEESFENGKWFSINADNSIKLRSGASPKAVAARKKIDEPHALRLKGGGKLTENELSENFYHNIAEGIIVDWKGPIFVDDKDKPLKCSAKNAYALVSDKRLEGFALFISRIILDEDSFMKASDEDAEKN